MDVRSKVKEMVLSARVIRADGTIEDLGTIQYWHSNPLKRLLWRIKTWLHF
jgi:hypothetical protein